MSQFRKFVSGAFALSLLSTLPAAQEAAKDPAVGAEVRFTAEVVEARFGSTVVIPSGLRGQIYNLQPGTLSLPKFDRLKPVGTIYTNGLNIPPRDFEEGFPGVTKRFEWFAIDYTGRFYISNPGKYRFTLTSDDGAKLYLDGKVVIDNDGIHGPQTFDAASNLAGGIHTIRISYFQGPRFQIALMLGVSGPGESKFRAFNTNEFKPPSNPEDWKFGSPDDLNKPIVTESPGKKKRK